MIPLLVLLMLPQDPPAAAPPPAPRERLGVAFDAKGWPIVDPAPARTGAAPVPAPAAAPAGEIAVSPIDTGPGAVVQPESGLPSVFAAIGSAASFASGGGVSLWWRLHVVGAAGETIGRREITHAFDAGQADRDRLEYDDGFRCGRVGPTVFAQRHGMPWPTATDRAAQELALFGLHARLPYAFADRREFAEVATERVTRGGETFLRIRFVRRPAGGAAAIGPDPEGAPRPDEFELWCPADGGVPVEFAHRLQCSGQSRRVRLEDWRAVGSVQVPFRRIYLDGAGRPTTILEVLRWEPATGLSEQDFRLH